MANGGISVVCGLSPDEPPQTQSLVGVGQAKEVTQGTHEGLAALCESQHSFVCTAVLLPG